MSNPYSALPDHQFWRRSIAQTEAHRVDPMVVPRFRLSATDRIVTAGSCFAQHIECGKAAGYEFINFDIDAVRTDLFAALDLLREVNPDVRVILTVSPVPLIATYEPRSVLVSTAYSKAVLRVAAEAAIRRSDWIEYFPSYEIITGSFSGGLYYEDDHREVNRLGVAHAMRCFVANFINGDGSKPDPPLPLADHAPGTPNIVCDEEVMAGLRT